MNIRIARKIYDAIGGQREDRYSPAQQRRAIDRVHRTKSVKRAGEFFHCLLDAIGAVGRAKIQRSPADAFGVLMRAPESEWNGSIVAKRRLEEMIEEDKR